MNHEKQGFPDFGFMVSSSEYFRQVFRPAVFRLKADFPTQEPKEMPKFLEIDFKKEPLKYIEAVRDYAFEGNLPDWDPFKNTIRPVVPYSLAAPHYDRPGRLSSERRNRRLSRSDQGSARRRPAIGAKSSGSPGRLLRLCHYADQRHGRLCDAPDVERPAESRSSSLWTNDFPMAAFRAEPSSRNCCSPTPRKGPIRWSTWRTRCNGKPTSPKISGFLPTASSAR